MADLPGVALPNLNTTQPAAPDLMGQMGNVLNLQKMMAVNQTAQVQAKQATQEFNDKQDIRNALIQNTQADPITGQPTLNSPQVLSDLMQKNPSAAMSYNAALAEMKIKQQQAAKDQLANVQTQNSIVGNIAQSTLYAIDNANSPTEKQAAYDRGHAAAAQAGIPASSLPTQYDPSVRPALQQFASTGVSTHDQIDQQMHGQGLYQENQQNMRTGAAALANEYTGDKTSTEFNQVNLAATQVQTAYASYSKALQQGKDTGPAVAAMIVGMGKSENPNISPRLATIEQLQHARGWSEDAQALLDKITSGGDIAPGQVKAIADFMNNRMEDLRSKQALTDAKYQGMAIGRGIPLSAAGLDNDHILSNPKASPNPFAPGLADEPAPSTTNAPAITAKAPAAQPAAPAASGKWIAKAKFDALPATVQTKIKADGIQIK